MWVASFSFVFCPKESRDVTDASKPMCKSMLPRLSLFVFIVPSIVACHVDRSQTSANNTFTVTPPGYRTASRPIAGRRIDLDPAPPWLVALPTQRIQVNDPVYKARREYEGYELAAVVKAGFVTDVDSDGRTELVFVCSDGYRPSMSVRSLVDGGVLAFRDVSVPKELAWRPLLQGRESVLPGPFYLVWPGKQLATSEAHPWPYRVIALELRSFGEELLGDAKGAGPSIVQGAELFKRYCVACHSMNLLGGTLGPELNVPANVTEYWNPIALRIFLADPSRIRSGSKMPRFADAKQADFDAIVDYLIFMRNRKIRVP